MALTCPSCGNDHEFLIKTAQVHVVQIQDGHVNVAEETRPSVFEVLCDKCEAELKLEDCDERVRQELLLTIGAV